MLYKRVYTSNYDNPLEKEKKYIKDIEYSLSLVRAAAKGTPINISNVLRVYDRLTPSAQFIINHLLNMTKKDRG